MIDLHYVRTSNGLKVGIMLEEVQMPYRVIEYDIFAGDHHKPGYKAINPNQKMPAIVDDAPVDGGEPLAVFETGAILIYLARKSGRFLPDDPRRQTIALQWLIWQVSGLGPTLGQAYHFARYAPSGQEYGIQRYTREAKRLLNVLDERLSNESYLAGDYSIADIACWPWVQNIANIGLHLEEFSSISRWSESIKVRPAVVATIGGENTRVPSSYLNKRMSLTASQWSNLFGN
jgi:GSH-dependent disulfide-bond oxidoreductase